jgi:hypothetical protein
MTVYLVGENYEISLNQKNYLVLDLVAEVASEGTSSEELYGMATVCFPGNHCNQFPAEFVYEALSR